jgi:hypothetical protein
MNTDQQVIHLATRIQRRRDFSAHSTGFLCGAVVLGFRKPARSPPARSPPARSPPASYTDSPASPTRPRGSL